MLPLSQLLILTIKRGDATTATEIIEEGTKELIREGDPDVVLESVCTVLMLLSRLSEAMAALPSSAPESAAHLLSKTARNLSKTCVEMMGALEEEDNVRLLGIPVAHVCRLYEVAQKTLEHLRTSDPRFSSLVKGDAAESS